MPLTVEDGTGKTDAEAYVSVADANTYLTAYGNPSAWTGATTADQERALRMGARYLDLEFSESWKGIRWSEDQNLDWPRSFADDRDDYAIESDEIPERLKRANAEAAAIYLADTAAFFANETTARNVESESSTIGPIRESINYIGGKPTQQRFPIIERLLEGLLRSSQPKVTRS